MPRITSRGTCFLCNGTFSKAGMTRHLQSCLQKHPADDAAAPESKNQRARVLDLVVEGRYASVYWLHLEVRASARLLDLDRFLRDLWLECCGHLSAFRIGEQSYSISPMHDLGEKGMRAELGRVLEPGLKFTYEYDFGSTTHLALKVASARDAEFRRESIHLVARNEPPDLPCGVCGKPAAVVCSACSYGPDGWLCKACAPKHECGDEMCLPVVNSPRVGVCGYTGQPSEDDEGDEGWDQE